MSAQRLATGKRICWRDHVWEIKRLLPNLQVNLEDVSSGAIVTVQGADLIRDLYDGQMVFVVEGKRKPPSPRCLELSDYPAHQVEIARFRLWVITPLLSLERRTRQIVTDRVEGVNQMLAAGTQRAGSRRVSIPSVYRWLADYEQSERDLRALIPSFGERGGKKQSRLEPEIEAIITSATQDAYLTREKHTLDDLLHQVAARVEEENQLRSPAEQLICPGRATLNRRVEALDVKTVFVARHGQRAAEKQLAQFGTAARVMSPLERVEIDHTRLDLIVVDDKDNLPLGRATLTDCMDVATRYPLGYYLGFEPPSYLAVMECLYHAICPKDNIQEKYATHHAWIAYGIPSTLVTDNGKEFVGHSLEDACLSLNITLEQMPIKKPHYKGKIERLFRTLGSLIHGLPGTTFSTPTQRGQYDSLGQACIYLDEVQAILNHFLIDVYAERLHTGLGGVPARRWEQALQNSFLPRLPASAEELAILLGQVTWRTIQPYGIEWECLRYNAPELGLLRNTLKKGEKAKIKIHPGDLSHVYVYNPLTQTYLSVPAQDPEGYTDGLSLWKHRVIHRFVLDHQESVDLAALGRAKSAIQDMVDKARTRQRSGTRSKIARWESPAPNSTAASPSSPPPPPLLSPEREQSASTHDEWQVTFTLPTCQTTFPSALPGGSHE